MWKRSVANLISRCLSPLGARVVSEWEWKKLVDAERLDRVSNLLRRFFRQLARKGFIPTHIVDVGAHKGDWSRAAREVFPECGFTLIEPQIEMKPYLDRFCSEAKNARWVLAGAGAVPGELPFTVYPDPSASSFAGSRFSEEEAEGQGLERRMVPMITLDSLLEGSAQPVPEIVKIDAEGFDLDVMKGARKFIGVTEVFHLELPFHGDFRHQSFHTMIAFMREHGYEPYDITDLIRFPKDGALGQVEMAFAKRAGVLRSSLGS